MRVDRGDIGGWLSGPAPTNEPGTFRGQRLGLPESGPGSMAGTGARVGALLIDWFAATLIARAFFPKMPVNSAGFVTLLVFAAEVFVLTWLVGGSFGQRLLRIRLVSLRGGRMPPLAIFVRTVLLCLAVPALIWDRDGRGLHDRWTNGVLIRG